MEFDVAKFYNHWIYPHPPKNWQPVQLNLPPTSYYIYIVQ